MIFLLEKIRKIFKSIGKKEETINDLITYKKFKKNLKRYNINFQKFNPELNVKKSIKMVAVISFFFDRKKIKNLNKICFNLNKISKSTKIYIITNNISSKDFQKIKKIIKIKTNIIIIKQPLHNRLLPWYHYEIMRKAFKQKNITHFMYLEDDMLLDKKNFNYWINSRKYLKKINLIPGFLRTEKYKGNKDPYAVDFTKKNKLNSIPNIKVNENLIFINTKYPYQGMYLYDRELMKEHLNGPSSNPDCGHGAFNSNLLDKRMINLDLIAKSNIGLTYMNVPQGFFSRIVIPYNLNKNQIDSICQINHLSNKYIKKKSWFGNIKVKDAII
tara:strand:+ start:2225 stop:3211 length:987 start_codon:yes stop_codon:yes gene_type:complete